MIHRLFVGGIYLWIGFTAGYFFRKWLEVSLLPRFRRERAAALAAEEPVDWVDEQGSALEVLPRREIRRRNLLHRVTATFVFHPDGRLFLQQRTMTKDVYPGLFDPCVGGTVASGETYEQNAVREVAEELGVVSTLVYFLFGHRFQDASTNSLIRVFACVHAGPLRLQETEVAAGEWAGEDRVDELLAQVRLCPDSAMGWQLYKARYGAGRNFAREIAPSIAPIQQTR